MTIKFTTKLYVDHDSIEIIRFFEKDEVRSSPTTGKAIETFNDSTCLFLFKRQMPIRLVGSEAEEAWANWKAYADNQK